VAGGAGGVCAVGWPQPGQNFAPAGSSTPHPVQCRTAGASAVPHDAQNFDPAGFDAWQEEQVTAAGAGCWAA
jgi:hypothetical protein